MKADSLTIADVFKGGGDIQYILPHFQREYSWEEPNWRELLDDATNLFAEGEGSTDKLTRLEHFLGSLVVIPDGFRAGVIPIFKLVDGQQRLTSISLLLKALATLVPTEGPVGRRIDKLLLNPDENGDLRFKILPTVKYSDRESFLALLRNESPGQSFSRIPQAFQFYQAELKKRIEAGRITPEGLLTIVTTSFKTVFINLDANESPYRIFESLNAKGKPLTQGDLIRNYVAMRLPAADQEHLFNTYWARIEGVLQEKRLVGRIGELTAFFRHYLSMTGGALVNEKHVYSRFRDRSERELSADTPFKEEISELWEHAQNYDALLRPESSGLSPSLQTAVARLNVVEAQTAYPFLLRILYASSTGVISELQLGEILGILENYLVRRFLRGESTNYQSQMFPTLWREIDSADIMHSLRTALARKGYPNDSQVTHSVLHRSIPQQNARNRRNTVQILTTINQRLSAGTGGYTVLDGDPTVEHLLPQTPSDAWKESLGPLWAQTHSELLQTLGNLTIVTGEWNSSLSNAPFPSKVEKLARHALALNNRYFTGTMQDWGRNQIMARASFLAQHVLEIWPSLDPSLEAAEETVAMEFSWAALERIARRLNKELLKVSQSRFTTADNGTRVVGLCSKSYVNARTRGYWYGFKPSQRAFLEESESAWLALECETADRLVLLPFLEVVPILSTLNSTEGKHWHIALLEEDGKIWLQRPPPEAKLELTGWLAQDP